MTWESSERFFQKIDLCRNLLRKQRFLVIRKSPPTPKGVSNRFPFILQMSLGPAIGNLLKNPRVRFWWTGAAT